MTIYNVEWEVTKSDGTKQNAVRQVESDHAGQAYDQVKGELEQIGFDESVTRLRITSISAL